MSYDPNTSAAIAPQLTAPAGDPAALTAAADRLVVLAARLDEILDATFAPLQAMSGWSGPGHDAAQGHIGRVRQYLQPVGETFRAGAGTTRRLAEELTIAQTETALAQAIANELARTAIVAGVPTAALFGQAIGVAGAAGQRADAARRQAMAEWAAQHTWSDRGASSIGDANVETATRGLFTAIEARLLAGALLTAPRDPGSAAFAGLGALGRIGRVSDGWGRILQLFGWAGPRTSGSVDGDWSVTMTRTHTAGATGLTDKDGFRGKRGSTARQRVFDPTATDEAGNRRPTFRGQPGRWPKDKGAKGFLGKQGDHAWFDKQIALDDKGPLTYDVKGGVFVDGTAGIGFHGGHAYAGADGSISAGVSADGRFAWDPRYGGVDIGGHAFVGAKADGGASLGYDFRRNEGRAHLGGEAMAGAEATIDGGANVGGVGARGGLTGYAGAGAKADGDLRITGGKVKARTQARRGPGCGSRRQRQRRDRCQQGQEHRHRRRQGHRPWRDEGRRLPQPVRLMTRSNDMPRADLPGPSSRPGISVEVPPGWAATTAAGPAGDALALVREEATGAFNPNLLVFADELADGRDLAAWLDDNLDLVDRGTGVDLEGNAGRESIGTIEGRPAMFRLIHMTTESREPPTELDQTQLFVEVEGAPGRPALVVQFFGTSPSTEIEANAATFTSIAHSLRVAPT